MLDDDHVGEECIVKFTILDGSIPSALSPVM